MNLFITADKVGTQSGGGLVTHHEYEALKTLGDVQLYGRGQVDTTNYGEEPWCWDVCVGSEVHRQRMAKENGAVIQQPRLAHLYAGTFSQTVSELKKLGCKITYTAAAHDVQASRLEHEKLGMQYNYPHLTQPDLWARYLRGYMEADVLITPSTHSAQVMRAFGCTNRIEVIPHGCEIPKRIAPLPKLFTVGYLGVCTGPDKGVRYLLEAWRKLDYKDAILVLGGRDSTHPFTISLVRAFGGGNIQLRGWVDNVSDFYDSISLYVQPSVTEGFGIEVLEALAHDRPVICSRGAGAADIVPSGFLVPGHLVPSCDVDALAAKIDEVRYRMIWDRPQQFAHPFTWDKIRRRYVDLWKSLLGE